MSDYKKIFLTSKVKGRMKRRTILSIFEFFFKTSNEKKGRE